MYTVVTYRAKGTLLSVVLFFKSTEKQHKNITSQKRYILAFVEEEVAPERCSIDDYYRFLACVKGNDDRKVMKSDVGWDRSYKSAIEYLLE